ncbi:MAG: hypothetical protein Q7U13_12115 [Rhodoferax sp.]|nr:hypothetical protein [Rhodoferax sp.]
MVVGLTFEDGADDHGDSVIGVAVAALLYAAGLQMQDFADPRPHQVGYDGEAGSVEHIDPDRELMH